jgi:soluble lytic murein transglycosylase-like protein
MMRKILMLVSAAMFYMAAPALANEQGGDEAYWLLREAQSLQILTDRVFAPRSKRLPKSSNEISYLNIIEEASVRYHIPKKLIAAVIKCESNWDPRAKSKKGAVGLMQVMPSTAEGLIKGSTPLLRNPQINIYIGTAYLRVLANKYAGKAGKVVAGYNVGPTWIDAGKRLPKETRLYRQCVSRWVQRYAKRF